MKVDLAVTLWKCPACETRYETTGEVAPVHLRRPQCDCGTPLEWRGETVRRMEMAS